MEDRIDELEKRMDRIEENIRFLKELLTHINNRLNR